ncbi:hypothetical protein [Clostridium sp. YIM B02569]|uniref:hypothetical protein n=1 Tax=Clostridium sp. YIM B02569 TaxID=2911967 RepID=UPI001EE9BC72|nr:hypothetical protein [Clostridium sp. YIM B02569]
MCNSEEIKNQIVDRIASEVKEHQKNELQDLTITRVKEIAKEVIESCEKANDMKTNYLKKKLVENTGIDYNNIYDYFVNEAIYNTDYQIFELENDKKFFFVRESLLSNDPNYNENLKKKIAKSTLLGIDYIADSNNHIYIINTEIEKLDLSKGQGILIEELDFRRLRNCRNLMEIKLSDKLKKILYLGITERMNSKLKIYYDIDTCKESLNQQIANIDEECEIFIPYSST